MFTINFPKYRKAYMRNSVDVGSNGIDALNTEVSPSTLSRVQEYARRAMNVFDTEPKKLNALLKNLSDLRISVFTDPTLAIKFVDQAYKIYQDEVSTLNGSAKAKKIREFSDFLTDVIRKIADLNQLPGLSLAIRSQMLALESGENRTRLQASMGTHNLKDDFTYLNVA